MEIQGFLLDNAEKLDRVFNGVEGEGSGERTTQGLFQKFGVNTEAEVPEDEILAEYDRIGGLIKKGDVKVKNGSFYDYKLKAKRPTPVLTFLGKVEGEDVELDEETAKAVQKAEAKLREVKNKKVKRALRKVKREE
jgi:hypothetical protein